MASRRHLEQAANVRADTFDAYYDQVMKRTEPWEDKRRVLQHDPSFEPTVVFPLAAYFAEAMDCPIEAFPRQQFAIHKDGSGHSFTDHAGGCGDLSLKGALRGRKRLPAKADDAIPA
jgi:hypothetical protein